MTSTEYQEYCKKKPNNNKYGAKSNVTDGIRFDSTKEANRYVELKLMQNSKMIAGLQRQVEFKLIGCSYICDFVYFDYEKKDWIVEDVKSKITRKLPAYRIKNKQMKELYGIEIFET
jgi:hypothetical protein